MRLWRSGLLEMRGCSVTLSNRREIRLGVKKKGRAEQSLRGRIQPKRENSS